MTKERLENVNVMRISNSEVSVVCEFRDEKTIITMNVGDFLKKLRELGFNTHD